MKSFFVLAAALLFLFPGAYALEIIPDTHLTPLWVKAGAYFRDNGRRVRVNHSKIFVMLPVSKNGNNFNYKTRQSIEKNVGEPDWSGWWHEPWKMGFLYYTVTANYNGQVFSKTFVAGRNKWCQAAEKGVELAKKIQEARSYAGIL